MELAEANAIVDEYACYIRNNMSIIPQGNGVCIVTPMLNRNNDNMNVYMVEGADRQIIISDLGETLGDLEISGYSVTPQREGKLISILKSYGVENSKGELFVQGTRNEMPERMNMLMQAMATVDDMYLLSQSTVRNLFSEDVGDWLLENGIALVEGPNFNGRSGMPYKFDYAIGRTKQQPMRLIKTVNHPVRSGIQNALFGWEDIRESRSNCEGYLFLNAKNTKDGAIPSETLDACKAYNLTPVQWGIDENDYLDVLAA